MSLIKNSGLTSENILGQGFQSSSFRICQALIKAGEEETSLPDSLLQGCIA